MKVFISWSGEVSRELAEVFREWMPTVIQAVKPYFTPGDVDKGARWSIEISKELEVSKVGLIMLTPENLEAPWIMFEAGALSKNISKSKVCPILFNVKTVDIKGPLVQFQAANFNKKEIKEMAAMINKSLDKDALDAHIFEDAFEMRWPKFKEKVDTITSKGFKKLKIPRAEREILEEILELSRDTSREISSKQTVWNVASMNKQPYYGTASATNRGYFTAESPFAFNSYPEHTTNPVFINPNAGVIFQKMCSKCNLVYTPSANDRGLCANCSKKEKK